MKHLYANNHKTLTKEIKKIKNKGEIHCVHELEDSQYYEDVISLQTNLLI